MNLEWRKGARGAAAARLRARSIAADLVLGAMDGWARACAVAASFAFGAAVGFACESAIGQTVARRAGDGCGPQVVIVRCDPAAPQPCTVTTIRLRCGASRCSNR